MFFPLPVPDGQSIKVFLNIPGARTCGPLSVSFLFPSMHGWGVDVPSMTPRVTILGGHFVEMTK